MIFFQRIQNLQIGTGCLKGNHVCIHVVNRRDNIGKFTITPMGMNLCFRLHTAVGQPECRNCKIKILGVPIWFSQRQFFSQCSFVNLNHLDSVCFQIQYFISNCQCNLRNGFLNGNIFSWEGPVQNGNRTGQHSLHDLFGQRLGIHRPIHSDCLFTEYIAPDNRWLYTSCAIGLYPCLFCKEEAAQCFAEILYHVISFVLAMHQNIQSNIFLPCNALCNLFLVECHILLLGDFALTECRTSSFNILRLRERTNSCGWELRQCKGFFLQILTLPTLRQSDVVCLCYSGKSLFYTVVAAISFFCK